MKKAKVISRKNLPARMPVMKTLVFALIIDRWVKAEWAVTLIVLLIIIAWIVFFASLFIEESVEIDDKL